MTFQCQLLCFMPFKGGGKIFNKNGLGFSGCIEAMRAEAHVSCKLEIFP
jgi:hypothetical protein